MKDFLMLIIVAILGFLGYQLIYKDKSMHQVTAEINEQVSESQAYLAKEYLEYKLPKLPAYKKNKFNYSGIKCFNDNDYDVACTIKRVSLKGKQGNSVRFDLTLFGVDDLMKHKVGLFDLNTANIGIKANNFLDIDFPNDEKFRKIKKYLDDVSIGMYLTSSKYSGKNKLRIKLQGRDDFFLSSDMHVSRDDKSEKIIKTLSNCLLDSGCEGELSERDFKNLASHLYFEELNSKLEIPKKFINDIGVDASGKERIISRIENDKNMPSAYKNKMKQFISGNINHSEDRISAKREVSFADIISAVEDKNESFFRNKFSYEVDGESYNPW